MTTPTSKKNSVSGFTLIEIVVVLSIISLFVGFTLNRFSGQTSEKIHKANVDAMVDFMTLARAKASSGESDTCSQTTESLYQIQVELKSSASLIMRYVCLPTFPVNGATVTPTPFDSQTSKVTKVSILSAVGVASPVIVTYTRKGVTTTGADLQISTSDQTPYNTCIRICDTGSIVQTQNACDSAAAATWSSTACN